jgi:hypothetical protein
VYTLPLLGLIGLQLLLVKASRRDSTGLTANINLSLAFGVTVPAIGWAALQPPADLLNYGWSLTTVVMLGFWLVASWIFGAWALVVGLAVNPTNVQTTDEDNVIETTAQRVD